MFTISKIPISPFVEIVKYVQCTGRDHLQQFWKAIHDKQGEGVILHKPKSLYAHPFYSYDVCNCKTVTYNLRTVPQLTLSL